MIRVGLIGAGFIGRNHFNQYQELTDRAKIVALCDAVEARRTGDWSGIGGNIGDAQGSRRDLGDIRPVADWREIVSDPGIDMVDICVPTGMHPEMTVAALNAGKHVLCEKPMALTAEACAPVLAAAEKAATKCMIAQCIRFWPEYVFLKQVFDDKRFGALKALHLRRQAATPTYTLNNWALDPALSGGAILDLHVHDTDFALFLLGKPKSVCAQTYKQPNGSVDRVSALWHYNPDLIVHIEGCWDWPAAFGFNMGFSAIFEKAAVLFDISSGKPLTVLHNEGRTETPAMLPKDGYFREIEYFLDCIAKNQTPRISTPRESRDAVAMATAEQQSAERGQPVEIQ